MQNQSDQVHGPTEGAPDPEVPAKAQRRRFTAAYKTRILEQSDACTEPGAVGRLLRREGLHSSHLASWRKARRSGSLEALERKRGRKPNEGKVLERKLALAEREIERLRKELGKAETILDVQ